MGRGGLDMRTVSKRAGSPEFPSVSALSAPGYCNWLSGRRDCGQLRGVLWFGAGVLSITPFTGRLACVCRGPSRALPGVLCRSFVLMRWNSWLIVLAVIMAIACFGADAARAQDAGPGSQAPAVDITGRDFAGQRLATSVQLGDARIARGPSPGLVGERCGLEIGRTARRSARSGCSFRATSASCSA